MAENGRLDVRDDLGRFQKGSGGGPGRPRAALTNALRRQIDPDALATELIALAMSRGVAPRDRIAALGLILDRVEGKAPASLHVTATASSALPATWALMTPAERARFLDELDANPALLLGAGEP